ncbi:hypothetical protein ACTFIV_001575 [Dictyostelium citrinum]
MEKLEEEVQQKQQQQQPDKNNIINNNNENNKETITWDVAEYGGYLFDKKLKAHNPLNHKMPLQYHHSQSTPHIPSSLSSSTTSIKKPLASLSDDESGGISASTAHSSNTPRKQFSFDDHCALIIANQKLPKKLVDYFWDKCSVKICADGGANRLYSLGTKINQSSRWIPDYIKGDLDSLHEGVSDFFSKKGSTIVLDSSQDTCDLQKCFELIIDLEKGSGIKYKKIFILGGLGGSFSHEFANVNTLFDHPDRKIILASKDNLAWLLSPTYHHNIICRSETKCSLIPLSSKASEVKTSGLKWNLVKQSLNFGELISTSNVSLDNKVCVETSNPLIFIVDINP